MQFDGIRATSFPFSCEYNKHTCKASRHVNLAAVSGSNYLSSSNTYAFRSDFLLRRIVSGVKEKQSWKLGQFKNINQKIQQCRCEGIIHMFTVLMTSQEFVFSLGSSELACPEVLLTQVHCVGNKVI